MTSEVSVRVALKRRLISLRDGTHGSFERVPNGIPLLSAKNISGGLLEITDGESCISEADYENIHRSGYLAYGDVLLSIVGSIGNAALFDTNERVAFQRSVAVLRPDSKLLPRYLLYQLQTPSFQAQLQAAVKTSAQSGVYLEDLGEASIVLPPLSRQHVIVAYLDRETARLDALVAAKERLLALLAEKRRALITHAVTRGLDPNASLRDSGIPWLGEIPAHWNRVQLRRFMTFITSGSRGWAEHYSEAGATFLRIGNLTRDSVQLDLSDVQLVDPPDGAEGARTRVQQGDLLFSITAYLGSIALVPEDIGEAYVNQHVALVRLDQSRGLDSEYVAYATLSDAGQTQLTAQGYGGTKTQLALDDIRELWFPVPPVHEQVAIIEEVRRASANIDLLRSGAERTIALARERRAALIAAAVTGQIDGGAAA